MKGIIIKKKSNNKAHYDAISRKLKAKKDAYNTGIKIAKKWIENASYQEIIDVLPRTNLHHDTNYFALMRNIFFVSIEKRYPNETEDFKWFNTVDFMRGWRKEVISMWRNDKIKTVVDKKVPEYSRLVKI